MKSVKFALFIVCAFVGAEKPDKYYPGLCPDIAPLPMITDFKTEDVGWRIVYMLQPSINIESQITNPILTVIKCNIVYILGVNVYPEYRGFRIDCNQGMGLYGFALVYRNLSMYEDHAFSYDLYDTSCRQEFCANQSWKFVRIVYHKYHKHLVVWSCQDYQRNDTMPEGVHIETALILRHVEYLSFTEAEYDEIFSYLQNQGSAASREEYDIIWDATMKPDCNPHCDDYAEQIAASQHTAPAIEYNLDDFYGLTRQNQSVFAFKLEQCYMVEKICLILIYVSTIICFFTIFIFYYEIIGQKVRY